MKLIHERYIEPKDCSELDSEALGDKGQMLRLYKKLTNSWRTLILYFDPSVINHKLVHCVWNAIRSL